MSKTIAIIAAIPIAVNLIPFLILSGHLAH
jgi:hypothetical protein